MKKYSSIQITPETKRRLANIGHMGDSYESIILRMLGEHDSKKVGR